MIHSPGELDVTTDSPVLLRWGVGFDKISEYTAVGLSGEGFSAAYKSLQ